jgi:hypothetical protein
VVTTVWLGTCPGADIGDFTLNLTLQAGPREQTVASGNPTFHFQYSRQRLWKWCESNGRPSMECVTSLCPM